MWNKDEITKWYLDQPWLTGCNFLPSNVINRLDMFQSYKKREHLEQADIELAFFSKLGFNSIRLWANFDVYYKEPNSFMDVFDRYIELARKYHLSVMIVLAYEEDLPFGNTFIPKEMGPQKLYFNHFNRDYEQHEKHLKLKDYKHYLEYEELKPLYLEMVRKIVTKYKDDKVVNSWNIYNEPGILIGSRAIPLLKLLFEEVRKLHPIQPLTADIWRGTNDKGEIITKEEQYAFELSDFCSFHSYSRFETFKRNVKLAMSWGKPVIVTEWLCRGNHNNFEDIYPWLYKNRIGSYFWGFIQGLTFVTEPWNDIMKKLAQGKKLNGFDMTKWQHELFRRNFAPYDYKEYKVLKRINSKIKTI